MVIEETKGRLIECGKYTEKRYEKEDKKPEIFIFLEFTHYSFYGRDGKFWVKRKTCRKNFAKKCKEVHRLIRDMRTKPLKAIIKKRNEIFVGYYYNCGITDNFQGFCKAGAGKSHSGFCERHIP